MNFEIPDTAAASASASTIVITDMSLATADVTSIGQQQQQQRHQSQNQRSEQQQHTSSYRIHIQEGDNDPVEVDVRSDFTASDVKRSYEVTLDTDWRPTDRLLFRQEEISEIKTLEQMGIVEKSRLYVERQANDASQVFSYVCANSKCGRPVEMKRDDIIRCRECNHRLVLKPRTSKMQRYIAR